MQKVCISLQAASANTSAPKLKFKIRDKIFSRTFNINSSDENQRDESKYLNYIFLVLCSSFSYLVIFVRQSLCVKPGNKTFSGYFLTVSIIINLMMKQMRVRWKHFGFYFLHSLSGATGFVSTIYHIISGSGKLGFLECLIAGFILRQSIQVFVVISKERGATGRLQFI